MKVKEESEKGGLNLNIQKTKIMTSVLITSWQIDGKTVETVTDFIWGGSNITTDGDCSPENKRHLLHGRNITTNLDSMLKYRYIPFPTKVYLVKAIFSPSSHVWMWMFDYKENWVPKSWCFWIVVFEKTLESPLNCKEIQPVHPKGNPSRIFIGRTDAEAETPILWPPEASSEELPLWKRPWCSERLKAGGEGDNGGCNGWMASPLQWTWVWANSRRLCRTGKPGMLQFMGSQRVRHNWVTE